MTERKSKGKAVKKGGSSREGGSSVRCCQFGSKSVFIQRTVERVRCKAAGFSDGEMAFQCHM